MQNRLSIYKPIIILVLLVGMSTFASSSWAAGSNKANVLDPTVPHFGTTYSDLAMAWWDWALNQPPDMNPILDETGAFAAVGQDEDFGQGNNIFFLAGTFGFDAVRTVTIPKDKALFFPLFNSLWIVPEECDTGGCREEANSFIDRAGTLECIINGKSVDDIFAYRAQSPPGGSPLHIRSGGLLESFAPDFYKARDYLPGSVADGYWILVELPKNQKTHTVEFNISAGDPEDPDFFALSVKYHLTVDNKSDDDDDDDDDDEQ